MSAGRATVLCPQSVPSSIKLEYVGGFDAVDAGKLVNARLLEPWAMLWTSGSSASVPRRRLRRTSPYGCS
jgi:hypothetical protein